MPTAHIPRAFHGSVVTLFWARKKKKKTVAVTIVIMYKYIYFFFFFFYVKVLSRRRFASSAAAHALCFLPRLGIARPRTSGSTTVRQHGQFATHVRRRPTANFFFPLVIERETSIRFLFSPSIFQYRSRNPPAQRFQAVFSGRATRVFPSTNCNTYTLIF